MAPSRPPNAPDSCSERTPASRPLPDTSTRTISSASVLDLVPATMKSPEKPSACAERISLSTRHPGGNGGTRPCAASRSRRSTSMRSPGAPWRPSRCRSRANAIVAPTETEITTRMPGIIEAAPHHHRPHAHPRITAPSTTMLRSRSRNTATSSTSRKVDGGTHSGCCAMPRVRSPTLSTRAAVRVACDRPLHRRSTSVARVRRPCAGTHRTPHIRRAYPQVTGTRYWRLRHRDGAKEGAVRVAVPDDGWHEPSSRRIPPRRRAGEPQGRVPRGRPPGVRVRQHPRDGRARPDHLRVGPGAGGRGRRRRARGRARVVRAHPAGARRDDRVLRAHVGGRPPRPAPPWPADRDDRLALLPVPRPRRAGVGPVRRRARDLRAVRLRLRRRRRAREDRPRRRAA